MTDEELLKKAAEVYKALTQYTYIFITGKNRQLKKMFLHFTPDQFKHMAGLHKSYEMKKRSSDVILKEILADRFKFSALRSSEEYPLMVARWEKMLNLPQYLNSFEKIYPYDIGLARSQGIRTDIKADYLISCENNTFFIFFIVDKEGKLIPCDLVKCIADSMESHILIATMTVGLPDYTRGQRRPSVVLYKELKKKTNDTVLTEILIDKMNV